MNTLNRCTLALLTLFVAFRVPAKAAEQTEPCVPVLPEQARQIIETKYASWRVLAMSDLNKDDQEIWSRTHKGECPGIVSGKFTSPGKADYAVLLLNKHSENRGVQIVLMKPSASSAYEATAIYSNDKVTNYPVIHISKPGRYRDFYDRRKFVQVDSDVLVYEHIESSALAFCYKGGRFMRLLISD